MDLNDISNSELLREVKDRGIEFDILDHIDDYELEQELSFRGVSTDPAIYSF